MGRLSSLSSKYIVDTNVPKTANLSNNPASVPADMAQCVMACVKKVKLITRNGGLVLDDNGEIFDEYRGQLSMSGGPGIGDAFLKWVNDNQWQLPAGDRVRITKCGNSYDEFPTHSGLAGFDPADMKFVAVANKHAGDPIILQATDSKWWGFKDVLDEVGISVEFLCPEYVRDKYDKKTHG